MTEEQKAKFWELAQEWRRSQIHLAEIKLPAIEALEAYVDQLVQEARNEPTRG